MLREEQSRSVKPGTIERPKGDAPNAPQFGSDVIAQTLRDIGLPYIALNPGASFRGLHDSLVNYLGNTNPQMLLCLHEEHAVAIAHGYAKVTGRPMAAAVHSNVGLMHATMAIFNAWCDRMPVIVLGATGPVDADKRRPWIDWIHTAGDQGALVRNYVKWDDQPASPAAAREALLRGAWISSTAPQGPVYINFDAEMQESPLKSALPAIDTQRYLRPAQAGVSTEALEKIVGTLAAAKNPVILAGRVSRSDKAWEARIALAETLGARVITDLKVAAAFPTTHRLHAGDLRGKVGPEARAVLTAADAIIALDWVDLSGALKAAFGETEPSCPVIRIVMDHHLHNGWSMDHQAHPLADLAVACDPDDFTQALLARLGAKAPASQRPSPRKTRPVEDDGEAMTVSQIAQALQNALGEKPASLTHVTLSWDGSLWPFDTPLDYLGSDGGGGIGAGPGHAVGAALALRDMGSPRIPVAICGDGDFLMGVTALWTAVHYRIPLLVIVANNRSFFNDEVHQEKVAKMRGREVSNKWIGMRMSDPALRLADMAAAQGCIGFGPVERASSLERTFKAAIAEVEAGAVSVVEVITDASYPASLVAALTPQTS